MKTQNLSTLFKTSLIASAMAMVVGCSDTNVPGTATSTASGQAFDWYISGATVYPDFNKDGIQQTGNEVTYATTTDETGSYTLTIPGELGTNYDVVVTGGTDTATNQPFTGTLKAGPSDTKATPATTLKQAFVKAGLDEAAATDKVKTFLGIPADSDIANDDPETPSLFAANLKANSLINSLSESIKSASSNSSDSGVSQKSSSLAVDSLVKALENSTTTIDDVSGTGTEFDDVIDSAMDEAANTIIAESGSTEDDANFKAQLKANAKSVAKEAVTSAKTEADTIATSTAPVTQADAKTAQETQATNVTSAKTNADSSNPITIKAKITAPALPTVPSTVSGATAGN